MAVGHRLGCRQDSAALEKAARAHVGRHGRRLRTGGHRVSTTIETAFRPLDTCQICGGSALVPGPELLFELSIYTAQAPELAAYSGRTLELRRCAGCGFGQPAALPALPHFFDRLYDQRWSEEWI